MTRKQKKALEIVIDLAEQNVIDELDCPDEYKRQCDAIEIVHSLLKDTG